MFSSLIILLGKIMFFSLLLHLTGVLCHLFKFFSYYQLLPIVSIGVLSEILLTPCAIPSIVLEAVCCWFHQVSSHLVKFMFNSFHLQSECCQNYIILIHSYLVSTRVVSILSSPLNSWFMSLQPSSSRNVPCSSFLRIVCNLGHLRCFIPFNLFNLSRFMVSLIGRRSNLVLPLIFLFLFPPVPS